MKIFVFTFLFHPASQWHSPVRKEWRCSANTEAEAIDLFHDAWYRNVTNVFCNTDDTEIPHWAIDAAEEVSDCIKVGLDGEWQSFDKLTAAQIIHKFCIKYFNKRPTP